jgi:hypothetical protein
LACEPLPHSSVLVLRPFAAASVEAAATYSRSPWSMRRPRSAGDWIPAGQREGGLRIAGVTIAGRAGGYWFRRPSAFCALWRIVLRSSHASGIVPQHVCTIPRDEGHVASHAVGWLPRWRSGPAGAGYGVGLDPLATAMLSVPKSHVVRVG